MNLLKIFFVLTFGLQVFAAEVNLKNNEEQKQIDELILKALQSGDNNTVLQLVDMNRLKDYLAVAVKASNYEIVKILLEQDVANKFFFDNINFEDNKMLDLILANRLIDDETILRKICLSQYDTHRSYYNLLKV